MNFEISKGVSVLILNIVSLYNGEADAILYKARSKSTYRFVPSKSIPKPCHGIFKNKLQG